MSVRSLPLYCTLTLIAMQGHQTKQGRWFTHSAFRPCNWRNYGDTRLISHIQRTVSSLQLTKLLWHKELAKRPINCQTRSRYEGGQRVTSWWQPATQTNMNPNRDKILARSNQPRTSETYRHQDDVFGYELQFLLSGALPIFQNLN